MQGCIILNGDYTYLNTVSWQKAVCLLVKGKATVLKHSERVITNFEKTVKIVVPAVMRLIKIVRTIYKTHVPFSKKNIMIRDDFKCAYCGVQGKRLTIDHIEPASRGGKSTFENCVAACLKCNNVKGDRTPSEAKMYLRKRPVAPTISEFVRLKSIKAGVYDLLEELGVY